MDIKWQTLMPHELPSMVEALEKRQALYATIPTATGAFDLARAELPELKEELEADALRTRPISPPVVAAQRELARARRVVELQLGLVALDPALGPADGSHLERVEAALKPPGGTWQHAPGAEVLQARVVCVALADAAPDVAALSVHAPRLPGYVADFGTAVDGLWIQVQSRAEVRQVPTVVPRTPETLRTRHRSMLRSLKVMQLGVRQAVSVDPNLPRDLEAQIFAVVADITASRTRKSRKKPVVPAPAPATPAPAPASTGSNAVD